MIRGSGQYIDRTGDTMGGRLWLFGDPIEDLEAVPKQYISALLAAYAPQIFCAYDAAGGTDIGTTWTDIPFDTEITKDDAYGHSAASITIATTGVYLITADCSLTTTAGTTNSNTDVRLVNNGTEIEGTRASCYTRESGAKDTASITIVQSFAANDVLKLQAQKSGASNTVSTLAKGSRITLQKLNATLQASGPNAGLAMGGGIFSFITYP